MKIAPVLRHSDPADAAGAPDDPARENARLRGDLLTMGRRFSHDLRTPLMGIATACEAIRDTAPGDAEARLQFTQSISEASEELVRLIERFGSVLKASAEPKPKEPVAMGEAVWGALQRLERRVLEKRATVIQPPSWPTVRGVPGWIETIWGNLIANALEQGGEAPRIELGWKAEPGGGWRFQVEDRGPGVSGRALPSLFFPFDRLHQANAPRGLGLPIAQRLVEPQGGTCGYEPREGGGARFYFTLPG